MKIFFAMGIDSGDNTKSSPSGRDFLYLEREPIFRTVGKCLLQRAFRTHVRCYGNSEMCQQATSEMRLMRADGLIELLNRVQSGSVTNQSGRAHSRRTAAPRRSTMQVHGYDRQRRRGYRVITGAPVCNDKRASANFSRRGDTANNLRALARSQNMD